MIILLTNDDGISSPGLKALQNVLSEHDVWTVAPDKNRSASSHSITIRNPVRMHQLNEKTFACGGTPADCVLFSLLGAIPVKPDIVISGINLGANLGTDIIYSGTVAAARQAALMGYPSIAVSLNEIKPPLHFCTAADFIIKNIDIFTDLWHSDHFLNINIPNIRDGEIGVKVTFPSRRIYENNCINFKAPNNDKYYFLGGSIRSDDKEGSDSKAVFNGFISISPVFLHPVNYKEEEKYHNSIFRKPVL